MRVFQWNNEEWVILSRRERQVLTLLCAGNEVKTIAHTLGLSPFTVKGHISQMETRLHMNRVQLSLWAYSNVKVLSGEPAPTTFVGLVDLAA